MTIGTVAEVNEAKTAAPRNTVVTEAAETEADPEETVASDAAGSPTAAPVTS